MPFIHIQYPWEVELSPHVDSFAGFRFTGKSLSGSEVEHQHAQLLMVWANRLHSTGLTKPNPPDVVINGKTYRFQFTSYAKANAATLCRLHAAFTGWTRAAQIAAANGLRLVAYDDDETLRRMLPPTGNLIRNVAYVTPHLLSPAYKGFILDYEVADARSVGVTSALFKRIHADFAHIPCYLYTNAVGSGGYTKSGLAGIEATSLQCFDGVSLLISKGSPTLESQLLKYKNARKCYVTVDFSLPLTELTKARNFILKHSLSGVNIWRNGQDPLTSLGKQKLNLFKEF